MHIINEKMQCILQSYQFNNLVFYFWAHANVYVHTILFQQRAQDFQ